MTLALNALYGNAWLQMHWALSKVNTHLQDYLLWLRPTKKQTTLEMPVTENELKLKLLP